MINKIQKTEQKISTKYASSGHVIPLAGNVIKGKGEDKLKELRRPRSRQYIKDLLELQDLLSELDKRRSEKSGRSLGNYEDNNPEKYIKSTGNISDSQFDYDNLQPKDVMDIRLNIPESELEVQGNEKNTSLSTKEEIKLGCNEAFVDNQDDNQQLKENPEISELEKRIQQKLDQLAEKNSSISELLSLIYLTDKEEYLMGCGIIQRSGTPVYSREDMSKGVMDPKKAQQLERGYDIFDTYACNPELLTLEIYIDAYCLIYKDGIVKTIV